MKTEQAIAILADVTLGEPITTHEDVRRVLADLESARRDFTEEEYPEKLHLERLAALAFIGKEIA
jgi:hypothetical protein